MAVNILFDTNDPFSARHFLRKIPDYVDARVLAASTSETHTVPADAKYVIFSAEADFWAKQGASASVPAADVTDGTAGELNPVGYDIEGVTQITLISETAQKISLAFYKSTP